jgi:hypothetical protein
MRVEHTAADVHQSSQPLLHQRGVEIQKFGDARLMLIALAHDARLETGGNWRYGWWRMACTVFQARVASCRLNRVSGSLRS